MSGDIEMSPAEEDLRDAMKDEAAFDGSPTPNVSGSKSVHRRLAVMHDHVNSDGTESAPSRTSEGVTGRALSDETDIPESTPPRTPKLLNKGTES